MGIPPASELGATIDRGNLELTRSLQLVRKGLTIANAVAATNLGAPAVLPLTDSKGRTRIYEVHVPWEDGIRLQKIRNNSEALKGRMSEPGVPDQAKALMATSVAVMGRLARPRGRFRRLAWRLGIARNPFRRCSEKELGELLDFFWVCRTKSSVLN